MFKLVINDEWFTMSDLAKVSCKSQSIKRKEASAEARVLLQISNRRLEYCRLQFQLLEDDSESN
jgi:hypothetical protein